MMVFFVSFSDVFFIVSDGLSSFDWSLVVFFECEGEVFLGIQCYCKEIVLGVVDCGFCVLQVEVGLYVFCEKVDKWCFNCGVQGGCMNYVVFFYS